MRADWLTFIAVLCLYQRAPVVGVPVVLADNTATPSLAAPIISQSASAPVARPAATPDHKEANSSVTANTLS